jgi:hypothetical protein
VERGARVIDPGARTESSARQAPRDVESAEDVRGAHSARRAARGARRAAVA